MYRLTKFVNSKSCWLTEIPLCNDKSQVTWGKILKWKLILGVWSNVCLKNENWWQRSHFGFFDKHLTKYQGVSSNSRDLTFSETFQIGSFSCTQPAAHSFALGCIVNVHPWNDFLKMFFLQFFQILESLFIILN